MAGDWDPWACVWGPTGKFQSQPLLVTKVTNEQEGLLERNELGLWSTTALGFNSVLASLTSLTLSFFMFMSQNTSHLG